MKTQTKGITKSKGQIIRENVFTLFNFLNFVIAALLFAVGAYSNMLFIIIIILNIVIGIAQEMKAKRLVDSYMACCEDNNATFRALKEAFPEEIRPLYGVVLEDALRPHAKETLDLFRKEGVEVKMISGDHVTTVSQIARRAGLHRWADAVDLSELGDKIDYDSLCEKYAVFARVTPKQKQELVKALKRKGRQVAMTGDGVNDLLALREADCSIAVAAGSDASRQISQIVLLDSDFTNLPQVVMEGRKVIHNVTRTAQVFFIKTIYSHTDHVD